LELLDVVGLRLCRLFLHEVHSDLGSSDCRLPFLHVVHSDLEQLALVRLCFRLTHDLVVEWSQTVVAAGSALLQER
jgi:hypothetical protein